MKYFQHRLTNEVREAFYNPDYTWYREITEAEAKGKPRQRGYVTQSYGSSSNESDFAEDLISAGVQIGLSLLGNDDSSGGFSPGGGDFGGGGSSADW